MKILHDEAKREQYWTVIVQYTAKVALNSRMLRAFCEGYVTIHTIYNNIYWI